MLTLKEQMLRAKEAGLPRFIPESPCNHGHFLRQTGSGQCIICNRKLLTKEQKAKRSQYAKHKFANRSEDQRLYDNAVHLQWQKDNPEKQKKWVRGWQKANRDKMQVISKRYYDKRKESNEAGTNTESTGI